MWNIWPGLRPEDFRIQIFPGPKPAACRDADVVPHARASTVFLATGFDGFVSRCDQEFRSPRGGGCEGEGPSKFFSSPRAHSPNQLAGLQPVCAVGRESGGGDLVAVGDLFGAEHIAPAAVCTFAREAFHAFLEHHAHLRRAGALLTHVVEAARTKRPLPIRWGFFNSLLVFR
jgi:hypothetical protein